MNRAAALRRNSASHPNGWNVQNSRGPANDNWESPDPRLRVLLSETPIIPAVRTPELLPQAIGASGRIVYLLCGDPDNLEGMIKAVNDAGKVPIVNLDLVSGLQRDLAAVTYLARKGVRGIISTHPEPLRAARKLNLYAIERTFLLDSAALQTALRSIDQVRQDAVEVLPAVVAPIMVRHLRHTHPDIPVIAGGLISTFREINDLMEQGTLSVSASNTALWLPRDANEESVAGEETAQLKSGAAAGR